MSFFKQAEVYVTTLDHNLWFQGKTMVDRQKLDDDIVEVLHAISTIETNKNYGSNNIPALENELDACKMRHAVEKGNRRITAGKQKSNALNRLDEAKAQNAAEKKVALESLRAKRDKLRVEQREDNSAKYLTTGAREALRLAAEQRVKQRQLQEARRIRQAQNANKKSPNKKRKAEDDDAQSSPPKKLKPATSSGVANKDNTQGSAQEFSETKSVNNKRRISNESAAKRVSSGESSPEHTDSSTNSNRKRKSTPDTSPDADIPAAKRSKTTTQTKPLKEAKLNCGKASSPATPAPTSIGEKPVWFQGPEKRAWSWQKKEVMSDGTIREDRSQKTASDFVPAPSASSSNAAKCGPRGLANHKNDCYFNSAIQVLNSALSDDQVSQLRGNKPLDLFVANSASLLDFNDITGPLTSHQEKKLNQLRSDISIAAAMAPNGSIDIAPYIGQLLLNLRHGPSNRKEKLVDAPFFLQVLAYGRPPTESKNDNSEGTASYRNTKFSCYNGDSQEDPSELLQDLLTLLVAESREYGFLLQLFSFTERVELSCQKCKNVFDRNDTISTVLNTVLTPPAKEGDTVALKDQIKATRTAKTGDMTCKSCGTKGDVKSTTTTRDMPQFLMVNISRNNTGNGVTKDKTLLSMELDGPQFEHAGSEYHLKSFIRHRGSNASSGHYFALRQHDGVWKKFDDKTVFKQDPERMVTDEGVRGGHTAFILLEKVLEEGEIA